MTFEQKNENAASVSQGRFMFVATAGGPSAFQSFLRGNPNGACAACTYTEAETRHRRAAALQPLRVLRAGHVAGRLELHRGLRRALFAVSADDGEEQPAGHLRSARYNAASAPTFANAAGTLINRTTAISLVGIIQAGVNSPYGAAIYEFKKDSIQPRIGFSWDPALERRHHRPRRLRHLLRPAAGRHLRAELVHDAADRQQRHVHSIRGSAIRRPGRRRRRRACGRLIATATDFDNPRMMQWNVGVTRRLCATRVGRSELRRQPRR